MSVRTDVVNLNVNINGDKGKDELNQLRKRAADLTSEMRNLRKGTDEYKAAVGELSTVNARMSELRNQIGLTALSQKELTSELKKMNQLKSLLTPGTEEFKNLQKEIDKFQDRLKEVRTGKFGFKAFFADIRDEVKQFGVLAAGYLGFEFITGSIKTVIGAQKKLSDENSNIRKTTSLTADQIQRLNTEFKEMDTRTSNGKLRQFAEEAGKLGKDGYEAVKKFVDEANMVEVALGEDLGDGAINKLAKLSGIFGQEMTNIASGINAVGQASAASESYQIDFAFRTAGTAKAAKLAAGDVLGYAAALEVNGQTAEVASTSLNNFFLDFVSKSNQFGKAAGFAKGELAKLINQQGTNEAFLTFLERLQATSKSTEEFVNKMSGLGIDGARGANVMLVLANNLDEVRKQQELANTEISKGTSIVNEYNIKNTGFAATVDKLSKLMNSIITSKSFVSFVTGLVDGVDKLARSLPTVIDWVKRNAAAFYLWGAAIIVNTGLFPRMIALIGQIITGIKGMTIAQLASEIAFRAQMAWITTLSLLKALWAGNIVKVRQEFTLLTQVLGRNPFGLLLVAAGAAVVLFDQWASKTKKLSDEAKDFLETTQQIGRNAGQELGQLELLKKKTQDLTTSLIERTAAAKKLQELWPSIFGQMTTEQILAGKIADAYDRAAKSIIAKAKASTYEDKLKEVVGKRNEQKELVDAQVKKYNPKVVNKEDGSYDINATYGENFNKLPSKEFLKGMTEYNRLNDLVVKYTANIIEGQKENAKLTGSTTDGKPLSEGAETDAERRKREAAEKKAARAAERAEKKLETIAQKLERYRQEAERLQNDLEAADSGKDAKQIQAIKDKYEKLLQNIERDLKDKKGNLLVKAADYAALVAGLKDSEAQELNNLLQKKKKEGIEQQYELQLQLLNEYYARERQANEEAYANRLIDKKAYLLKLKKLESNEADDKATVDGEFAVLNVGKAVKAAPGSKANATKKRITELDADVEASNRAELAKAERAVIIAKVGSDAELAAKRALLKKKFELDSEYLDKSSAEYKKSQAQLNKDIAELDKVHLQEKITRTEQVLNGLSNVFSSYLDLLNQKDQVKLDNEKAVNDKRKKDQDTLLKKKLISQKQYDTAVEQLDNEMNERQKEITAQQAKRTKTAALFAAIINGALGITKIWADYAAAPYYAAALTAIEVAAVGVQIATINQQAAPKGRKGLVVSGSSHEQGGIDMIDRGTGRAVANIEGGEPVLVLSKNTYGNNRDYIDQLLYNSQNRNGARIAAPWYGAAQPGINSARIIPFMRSGGVVNNTNSATASAGQAGTVNSDISGLMQQLIAEQQATREILLQQQNKPVRAFMVYQDITNSADLLQKAKSVAGVNQAA